MRCSGKLRTTAHALLACVLLLACAAPGLAQERNLDLDLPEGEIEERLEFLEQRLEATQLRAQIWQYGWVGVYGVSAIANSVEAASTDDDDDRVASIVNAGKSTIGFTQMLLDPLPARLGADPVRAMPDGTPQGEVARLRRAEALLQASAERARQKYTFRPHLQTALVNLAGGGLIWAFGEWEDAALSTGLGLLVGELQIWTLPNQPYRDLAAYQARFGRAPGLSGAGWHVAPRPNGITIAYRF